jgi:hypothetical protein
MARTPQYVTKKELDAHKKEVNKLIKQATKGLKKSDVKQDKKLLKKKIV